MGRKVYRIRRVNTVLLGLDGLFLQLFNHLIVRIKADLDKLVWACFDEILKSYFQLTVKLHV